ncbi:TerB family tellurite resistance protein [Sphingobacterium sp. KU25419]|nr:TerB family tellurite resistance protein [Sphingobacterium sp. KU25419]
MKKGYEILNGGYNTVKNISEGNFSIHKTFLDGLMAVSPEVRKYRKVALIIDQQVLLVKEYKAAYARFSSAGAFHVSELRYMERVYGNLFNKSLKHLDELMMVITAGKLRMADDERLRTIDRIHADMEEKLQFLREFNNSTTLLSIQREKELKDANVARKIYGLAND